MELSWGWPTIHPLNIWVWQWFPGPIPRCNFVWTYYLGQRLLFGLAHYDRSYYTSQRPSMGFKPTMSFSTIYSGTREIITLQQSYCELDHGQDPIHYLTSTSSHFNKRQWPLLFGSSKYSPSHSIQQFKWIIVGSFGIRTWRFITMYTCHGIEECFSWQWSFFFFQLIDHKSENWQNSGSWAGIMAFYPVK